MNINNRDTKFNDANLPFLFRKVGIDHAMQTVKIKCAIIHKPYSVQLN